jgi:hypothetical protein
MVWHEVENNLQISLMGVGNQVVEVGECAEERMNIATIRHIVAESGHRRRKDRREPDCINSQINQIIKVGSECCADCRPDCHYCPGMIVDGF